MSQENLNLDTYVRAIWRAKWIIILVTIAAVAVAVFIARREPVQHRATAFIRIGRVWKEPLEDYIVAEKTAASTAFLKAAASRAGLNPRQLRRAVHVETLQGGARRNRYPVLLQVTATSESDDAAQLVSAVADEIIARHEVLFEQALKPHLEEQRRLEDRQKELTSQPGARELLLRVESELDSVRANNSLTNTPITEKTHLISDPTSEPIPRQSIWRKAAAAGVVAAAATALLAAVAAHFRQPHQPEQHAANS
jgi:prophage DNA circulation protein